MKPKHLLIALPYTASGAWAADRQAAVRFRAMVGGETFACRKTYAGIGTTKSMISPRDFRFYVHNVALVDDSGKSVPIELAQDGKWQPDNGGVAWFRSCHGRLRERHAGQQKSARFTAGNGLKLPSGYREWIFLSAGRGMTSGLAANPNGPRLFDKRVRRSAGLPGVPEV